MELIPISESGQTTRPPAALPAAAREVLRSTAALYRRVGYQPPWIGYLALEGDDCVGTCAFTGAPRDGRVEIAYFTFPGQEGRGVATRMASALLVVAQRQAPEVVVAAQTLPQEGASTHILTRLGFRLIGPVDHPEDGPVWEWQRPAAPGAGPPH